MADPTGITFTFDTNPFKNAIGFINDGINQLTKRVLAMGVSFLGLRGMLNKMPEIGRTFSMAGDIITSNLLWPLRKELLPLLQKLLNWVRDHRTMFVQWGNVLVNIFRIIKNIVVGLIDTLRGLWERLSSGIERIFGKTVNTMSDLVNILLFKISAVASFIMVLLEPVFKFIVDSFLYALEAGKNFFSAVMEGAGNVLEPLSDLWEVLKDIGRALGDARGQSGTFMETLKKIGTFIGATLRIAIESLVGTIDALSQSVSGLAFSFKITKAMISGNKKEYDELIKKQTQSEDEFNKRMKKRWEGIKGASRRVVDYQGKEEEALRKGTPALSMTNTTNTNKNVTQQTVSVQMGNQNITVTGKDDAKEVGRAFGKSVYEEIRQNVNDGKMRRGARP